MNTVPIAAMPINAQVLGSGTTWVNSLPRSSCMAAICPRASGPFQLMTKLVIGVTTSLRSHW